MEFLTFMQNLTANADIEHAQKIAYAVLNVIMGIGAIVCICYLAINGVKMSKVEDEDQIKVAKKRVKFSILGLVICVAAITIGNVIIGLAQSIFK